MDTAEVQSRPGIIRVTGVFLEGGSSNPGFRASLEGDSTPGAPPAIRLVLTSTRRSLATTGQLFFHGYRAAVVVPAGSYRVQVVHARAKTYVSNDAPGEQRTVIVDTVVAVP